MKVSDEEEKKNTTDPCSDPLSDESKEQSDTPISAPKLVPDYRIPKKSINNDEDTLTVYNFIGNKYYMPSSLTYFDNPNPATSKTISQVPRSNAADIDFAIAAAKKAFKPWSRLPPSTRTAYLNKLASIIESRLDEFAKLETRDNGKPFSATKKVDIPKSVDIFRFYASQIQHDFTAAHQLHDALNYSHRSALGVCGLITPWNFPMYLLTWKIAPAIACGNTIVCKPSEMTPMTAYFLTDCILEAGMYSQYICNMIRCHGVEW